MRVGVVGDIHGSYRELQAAVKAMGKVDHLLFTGDGCRELARLEQETGLHVRGVVGNCDFMASYPAQDLFYLDGYKVFLTHGHLYGVKHDLQRLGLAGQEQDAKLVVFGHTHLPFSAEWHGISIFNPGTLCRERACRGLTYGIIETTPGGIILSHGKLG